MRGYPVIRLGMAIATVLLTVASFAPAVASPAIAPAAVAADAPDPRFFPQTGFRIDNDKFFDYFQKRGGVNQFGFPISRTFHFLGKTVQFFQRRVLQINPDGGVGQLNLLDSGGLMPFTTFNFATFPPVDPNLIKQAPAVGSPNYNTAVLAFIRQNVPNTFQGLPVNFFNTFQNTVSAQTAFPSGGGNPSLLLGFDLEMWGLPLSAPAFDPNNHDFVYQRFQRGIMHFDNTTHLTTGILTADFLKSIITGNNLPADLAQEAAGSPLLRQYDNTKPNGLNNLALLPDTNLIEAFDPEAAVVAPSLRFGYNVQMPGQDQPRVLQYVTQAGFGWIRQQIRWSDLEPSKGNILFSQIDPIVNAAQANGVNVMFSIVTSPPWARADHLTNAPPDNFNDFGDFVAALARRYDGRVQAYEIWNEQNFTREWAPTVNPGAYVELLKVGFRRIKAVDPRIVVVSGALTPTGVNNPGLAVADTIFLSQMELYQGGVFKTVADAVGGHMAGYNNPPQDSVDSHSFLAPCFTNTGEPLNTTSCFKSDGQFYFRRIDELHAIMLSRGDGRQMWITEYEWGAATPPIPAGFEWTLGLTDDQVASFFTQSVQMIEQSRPWVGAIFIWNLNFRIIADPHTTETALFGVLNPDFSPRIIYTRLAQVAK